MMTPKDARTFILPFLAALGVACFRLSAWTQFSGSLGLGDDSFVIVSHFAQLIGMVVFVVADLYAPINRLRLVRLACGATALTIVGMIICLVSPQDSTAMLSGAAVTGAASSVVLLAWGDYVCSITPRSSALGLTLGFALYGVFTWLFSALPRTAVVVASVVGPVVALACLLAGLRLVGDRPNTPDPSHAKKDGKVIGIPAMLCVILALCMITNLVAKILIPLGSGSGSSLYRFLWPLLFAAVFVVIAVWSRVSKDPDSGSTWPVFVAVLLSGLIGYPALAGVDTALASAYLRATQDCLMLFCWVAVSSACYREGLSPVGHFGLATLVFVKPPLLVSTAFLIAFPSHTGGGQELIVPVVSITAFVLVILALLLMATEARTRSGGPVPPGIENRLSNTIDHLARQYELTPREADIASLFVRGFTMAQSSTRLNISLDTVRAHSKSLYRKMGIHKKEELVNMVDDLMESSADVQETR